MAHRQIYLGAKRAAWAEQFKPKTLKGAPLRPAAVTANAFHGEIAKLVESMISTTRSEISALFGADTFDAPDLHTRIAIEEGALAPLAPTMDASIASQARILMNKLQARFTVMFNRAATDATRRMVERSLRNSATTLKTSLKEMAGNVTLKTDILTSELSDVVTASIAEAVGLIKRVPEKYLGQVQGDVMRSITSGTSLEASLDKQGVMIRNWSKNTAMDQTRKVYNSINRDRMQAVGVKKFEWLHSGGSNQPREYHKAQWPQGLNGGIFSFDDLPVIDKRTGERGIPGQAPNCHCVMIPVFSFDDDDDDE